MAFDGITTNCIMQELNHLLAGQRISKIAQPEREELLFTFKALNEGSNRLLISAILFAVDCVISPTCSKCERTSPLYTAAISLLGIEI